MSVAVENFLKAIYTFSRRKGQDTRPGTIARELNISNAAATDMARKLAERQLIHYEKYQQLELTEAGTEMALQVIRRHRLWEAFLHHTLGLSLHEIHREAELLEHQTSDFLTEKISEYLGHPDFDPHGDPIPRADGDVSQHTNVVRLSQATPGKEFEVIRLDSSDEHFFALCQNYQLGIGSRVEVIKQLKETGMTEIMAARARLLLTSDFTTHIYLKTI